MSVKKCSRCEKEFDCKVDAIEGCWCSACKLDKETGEALREQFADCLCPDCLSLYENAQTKQIPG